MLNVFVRHPIVLASLLLALLADSVLAATPEITIVGGTKTLRENVLHYLSIAEENCNAQPWRLNALLGASEREIRSAGQALGYYELEYEAQLTHTGECWGLNVQLTPGKPVLVTELRIEVLGPGEADPIFQSLFDKPGIKIGNRFNHDKYEKLKSRFGTLAAAHGYFDAEFALSQVVVNVAEKSARIALVYNTGPRYKIGEINIKHNILSEKFLQRYFTFKEGDDFDSDKLLELKNHFNASNYFAAATASPDMQSLDDGKVPIDVVLEERKRREYSIGAGAATDTGPRLLLGYEDRYLNQRGHRLAADLNTSEVKTTAKLAYIIPMKRPAQEFLNIYTGYEEENTNDIETKKDIYGTSYTYLQHNKWLQTYAIDYEQEESVIAGERLEPTDLIIPSMTINRVKTDGNPYPMGGWSLLGRLSGSPQSIGSDYSFIQFYGRAKFIKGFERGGRVLWRTEIGTTSTVDFDELPASVRFFAGGDQSVRGYGYESLGELKDDKLIGGKHLLTSSLEYDYRLTDTDWVGAVFFDMGNAADELENVDFQRGAGLGIRWISPIGPIRLDLAKALDGDKGWRVHISMGPDL